MKAQAETEVIDARLHDGTAINQKITRRLIYPFLILFFLSSVDRVNIGFAAIQMNEALGLTPQTYGIGVSLFFAGYMLFQVPSVWLLQRFGMRRWITFTVFSWGLVATATALTHNAPTFFLLRFLLGIAEAGFAPGVNYCCTFWMPKRFRAAAISRTMLAIPVSVILGGPLSGWLMDMNNPWGIEGWRWMIFLEGIPTLLLGVIAWWYFVDKPADAKWLSPEERLWIADEIGKESQVKTATAVPLRSLLSSRLFWVSAYIWLALLCGSYGLLYWLPLVIKHVSTHSNLVISMLSALPWLAIGLGMVLNAKHSDQRQERHLHIALPAFGAAVGLCLASWAGTGWLAMLLLVLGGYGIGAAQGTFWTLPATFLAASALPIGMALINMGGNLGGLLGPSMIGWIRERTGSFDLPVYIMAGLLASGALAVFSIRPRSDVKTVTLRNKL
jgi:MFS family permease